MASYEVVGTGTWNIDGPINHFTFATYIRDGKTFELPVEVRGDQITGDPNPQVR